MWHVDFLVQDKGKTEGAQITHLVTGESKRILKQYFYELADFEFDNAEYCDGGVLRGKKGSGGLKFISLAEVRSFDVKQKDINTNNAHNKAIEKNKKKKSFYKVAVEDIENFRIKLAQCCKPLPGDEIIGFISHGSVISVHKNECENAADRLSYVDVKWTDIVNNTYNVTLEIITSDRGNLLTDIINIISSKRITILEINANTLKKGSNVINMTIEISRSKQLDDIISEFNKIQGVFSTKRTSKTKSEILWTHLLMCMDIEVAKLRVAAAGLLDAEFIKPKYLPVGVRKTYESLMGWFSRRRIPASREHLERMEWVIGSIDSAIFKSLGLNLSDSYWVKPINKNLKWSDVNFFNNDFTDNVGEYLMTESMGAVDISSPSVNTEGAIPKKWSIVDGNRRLIKSGMHRFFLQYNEVAAYRIGKALGLSVLPYGLCELNTCCFCPCFIRAGQNLVTADDILQDVLGDNAPSDDARYDNNPYYYDILCKEFGREYIDGILLFDYIIRNQDRHTRNIAKIQDAVTRKYIRNSPIFDNGSSLMVSLDILDKELHNKIKQKIKDTSRPFYSPHSIQITLIDKTPFIPKLQECAQNGIIGNIIRDVYKDSRIDLRVIDALAVYTDQLVKGLLK